MFGNRGFLLFCCLVATFVIVPPAAHAQDLATAAPLLCAFTMSVDCDGESGCSHPTLEELDLPPFFKVDFQNRVITDVEALGGRTARKKTPIQALQRMGDLIVLQGVELRGWSMTISERSGKMTLTASDDDEAFVLFGNCTGL